MLKRSKINFLIAPFVIIQASCEQGTLEETHKKSVAEPMYFLHDTTVLLLGNLTSFENQALLENDLLNVEYLKNMDVPVKAALSFLIWNGRKNRVQKLSAYCDLSVDSKTNIEILRHWFRFDQECLKKISTDPEFYYKSYNYSNSFREIFLTIKSDTIKIFSKEHVFYPSTGVVDCLTTETWFLLNSDALYMLKKERR